jgi:hypothetical protein
MIGATWELIAPFRVRIGDKIVFKDLLPNQQSKTVIAVTSRQPLSSRTFP